MEDETKELAVKKMELKHKNEQSKVVATTILGGLALAGLTLIIISGIQASQQEDSEE